MSTLGAAGSGPERSSRIVVALHDAQAPATSGRSGVAPGAQVALAVAPQGQGTPVKAKALTPHLHSSATRTGSPATVGLRTKHSTRQTEQPRAIPSSVTRVCGAGEIQGRKFAAPQSGSAPLPRAPQLAASFDASRS